MEVLAVVLSNKEGEVITLNFKDIENGNKVVVGLVNEGYSVTLTKITVED